MTSLGSIRWIALALLGLAVAAGVSLAASQLVSQRIGLAAEPVSAGKELAPPGHESGNGSQGANGGDANRPTSTSTTTTTVPAPTSTVPPTTPPTSTSTAVTPPPPATSSQGGSDGEPADD
jgi:hypothetical protein